MDKMLISSTSSKRKYNPEFYYFFLFILVCIFFVLFGFFFSPEAKARAADNTENFSRNSILHSTFGLPNSNSLSFIPVPITVISNNTETKYLSYIGSYKVKDIISELNIDITDYKVLPPLEQTLLSPYIIRMVKLDTKLITEVRAINYDTEVIIDDSLYQDAENEKQAGENGSQIVTFKTYFEDGQFVKKEIVNSEITKQPITRIVYKGTKIYFNDLGNTKVQYWANVIDTVDATPAEKFWLKQVMKCESMGRETIVDSTNSFHGLYQYNYTTWTADCKQPADEIYNGLKQINCTLNLYRQGFAKKWPVCSN